MSARAADLLAMGPRIDHGPVSVRARGEDGHVTNSDYVSNLMVDDRPKKRALLCDGPHT